MNTTDAPKYSNSTGTAFFILFCTCEATSIINLIAGFVSWLAMSKFRTFQNYVFLNTIFAGWIFTIVFFVVCVIITLFNVLSSDPLLSFAFSGLLFVITAYNFWLFICSAMFYFQIVKVFGNVRRRYLKSALIGWGAPGAYAIIGGALYFASIDIEDLEFIVLIQSNGYFIILTVVSITIFLPLIINVCIFVLVLHALLKNRTLETKNRIKMATLVFVMSGSLWIAACVACICLNAIYVTFIFYTQRLLVNLLFLMFKSNWVLWCQACRCRTRI